MALNEPIAASAPPGEDDSLIVDHVARIVRTLVPAGQPLRHLDVGAGWGHLIHRLQISHPQIECQGIDYNPAHFELHGVPIAHGDFNVDRLPYPDASFDLVTCTEVVEHLENYRHVLREAFRVTRPGGWLVVSTPNVLSLKSRWVYFIHGFFVYFDPQPLKDDSRFYPGQRHITPVPFFHLGHALLDAGFSEVTPHCDKSQRSSSFWAAVLGPLLRLFAGRVARRRIRHFGPLPESVETLARLNNSWPVLTGRTLIVTARRAQ
ncbi:MAG TPA: class I SAM-dependent methyltransferase [Verrucomicrobiota bacterium]|nr:SAM-dependent methyltransferase [Verrucomicrobiales bacterium]HRI14152.1 class I SAM-dependent methyltransferase [Verrucomicrobiota bacterium]